MREDKKLEELRLAISQLAADILILSNRLQSISTGLWELTLEKPPKAKPTDPVIPSPPNPSDFVG